MLTLTQSLNFVSFTTALTLGYPGFNTYDNLLGKLQCLLSHLSRINFVWDLGTTQLIWVAHACRPTYK